MRIRQILLVHPNRSTRALIKKYIFSELSDVEFFECDNGCSALADLNMNPFDVVIVTTRLIDMPAIELKSKLAETAHNEMTPFIILSEDENGDDRQRLQQLGFQHVVALRVRPAGLIEKINEVCDPRMWRKDKRFYIPKTDVLIDVQGHSMEASLINISRGGILLELITYSPELLMASDLRVTLRVSEGDEARTVSDLACRLLRLNITEWQPNSCPAAMRVTFVFNELAKAQTAAMEELLRSAVEENPQIEA
ncbi:MAG: response regulator [Desulfobacterales bacterium]|nr:response regulator [Desulfobacterales bacterium]